MTAGRSPPTSASSSTARTRTWRSCRRRTSSACNRTSTRSPSPSRARHHDDRLHPPQLPLVRGPGRRRPSPEARHGPRPRRADPLGPGLPHGGEGLLLPRLPGRLGLLVGYLARLSRHLHARPPDGRRLAGGDPPRVGSLLTRAALAAGPLHPHRHRAALPLRVGPPGPDESGPRPAPQGAVLLLLGRRSGPMVLLPPAGRLLRHLELPGLEAQQPVATPGRNPGPVPDEPHAGDLRPRPDHLRAVADLRVGRLADVAAAALVLDHLRLLPGGQPGDRGLRLPDRHRRAALAQRHDGGDLPAAALPRLGQAPLRLRDDLDVLLLLAVADHLGGQPAGGDLVLPRPHPRRLRPRHPADRALPFCGAVLTAAVARPQAQRPRSRPGGGDAADHALGRAVLAGRAGVPREARGQLLALRGGAAAHRRHLARPFLPRAQFPAAAADPRPLSAGGDRPWPAPLIPTSRASACTARASSTS